MDPVKRNKTQAGKAAKHMAELLTGKEELITRARLTLGEDAGVKHFEAVFEKKAKAKAGGRDF